VDGITDEDVAALVRDVGEAADAHMRGDMRAYARIVRHADEYTLMAPYGGEPVHGFDDSEERLEANSRYFRNGEARLDVVRTHASGDLAVLVAVERQHGEVGGTPDQDWSLRVTLVFRREGSGWLLLHRHADPLVHPITMDQLGALARGRP
jgi:ketosteroid isomerase-like protein